MSPKDIKNQVREILEKPAAHIRGSKEKVAKRIRETMEATRSVALKKVVERIADLRPTDLMSRFGSLTFSELMDRLKKSDIARHSDAIRTELLTLFGLPSAEQVERLQVEIEKVAKELSALKALKTEVKKLSEDVKALKTPAKKAEKNQPEG